MGRKNIYLFNFLILHILDLTPSLKAVRNPRGELGGGNEMKTMEKNWKQS